MFTPSRAVFVGDGTLLIRCAQALQDAGHAIAAVASADPAILEWARAQGVPAEAVGSGAAPQFDGIDFDYLFSVAWLRVLPDSLIRRARRGALNFHDGPLPRYAGLNAPAWALMAGEGRHGITWHEMTAEVDRGRIARQALFELAPDETAFSLNARCYEAGFASFCELLADIGRGELQLSAQAGEGSYFARHQRPAALGTFDWRRPATELQALARGLDFGNYANPLGLPKLWLGDGRLLLLRSAQPASTRSPAPPGTVVEAQGERLRVAANGGDLLLEGCRLPDGTASTAGLRPGQQLPTLDEHLRVRLEALAGRLARAEPHWRRALSGVRELALPWPRPADAPASTGPVRVPLESCDQGDATAAGFAAWLCALGGQEAVTLRYADGELAEAAALAAWTLPWWPLTLHAQPQQSAQALRAQAQEAVAQARGLGPVSVDLPLRLGGAQPRLPLVGLSRGGAASQTGLALELRAEQAGGALSLLLDPAAVPPALAPVIARQLDAWLQAFARAEGALAAVSLLPPAEAAQREAFNATRVPLDLSEPVHAVIARTAAQQGDAEALRGASQSLSHAQLQQRAQALARALRQGGVRSGDVVGICLPRGPELVVSVLAVLAAGAAYLPLDPEYPRDRLRFMVADSGATRVVCRAAQRELLGLAEGQAVAPDTEPSPDAPSLPAVPADAAAYLIYTSGSTGQPKGVVVSHANVLNFFAGMDARVPHEPGARWLAVTSLSFDISVLELLWTLARGITVAVHGAQDAAAPPEGAGPDFSLFYFASDESAAGADRYRLLMEGARFADDNGFAAVWTPERHFHAFGGLYPNPMVTSAAIAAATRRVQIRAGSCVLPLHHPVRLAEDWALVDNLSNGRVGVSFAAGWQPNDFVLAPQAFADRKQVMLDGIDTVRRLWRGEALAFPGPKGDPVTVRTLPRPVQPELPVWLTAASNPETFQQAGEKGCHVLTHLLGQTVEDVEKKVALYRQAWREAGHAGQGQVTLMLHTFVGADEESVRETARGPMKAYLRSSVDLIRQAAWTFPTFVQRGAADGRTPLQVMESQPLSEEDMDALLDHAFSRYWNTAALIGTPEKCLAMVQRLHGIGIDEIACLIDFGIATDTVLAQLPELRRLMQLAQGAQPAREAKAPASVAQQLLRHEITHLQCTPSMATMLVADAEGRSALSRLSALLVGGEALPVALARQLRALVPGKLLNMYGPTETTVWSSCCALDDVGDLVPLGQPIANTQLRVRSPWGQECPAMLPGELLIGGAGVTRGYHGRPELSAQRFIDDPLHPGERLYRTGDLVRWQPDGRLEFLGRLDHQVKIRGHRIELGEIEEALLRQPGVHEAVVLAQPDAGGELALVGHVTAREGMAAPAPDALRQALAQSLPEVMVPRRIVLRSSMPRTPNGKTDRKALAEGAPDTAPKVVASAPAAAPLPAATPDELEQSVADIWQQVLGLAEVGRDANFFDLGGHSLLVIQVQRRLKESLGQEVSITDMFRLPTVAAIAAHLRGQAQASAVAEGRSRAQARRALRAHAARAA